MPTGAGVDAPGAPGLTGVLLKERVTGPRSLTSQAWPSTSREPVRRSTTGGELDVDCNASPEQICGSPIENVFWPVGGAPEGTYTYWVELFQKQNTPGPVPFTVQVLLGQTPAETRTGVARAEVPKAGPFEFTFTRARPKAGRAARAVRSF